MSESSRISGLQQNGSYTMAAARPTTTQASKTSPWLPRAAQCPASATGHTGQRRQCLYLLAGAWLGAFGKKESPPVAMKSSVTT